MNPGRYFIPNMGPHLINPINLPNGYIASGRLGLLNRIVNSIKAFNWNGLLNGASKTINVMNQTIPLVRQAKPMFNNMKSILQLAKSFNNETSKQSKLIKDNKHKDLVTKKEVINNNYPNFFI